MLNETQDLATDLLASLLDFTKVFFKLRTGRDFTISNPVGRESHYITICKRLTDYLLGRNTKQNLIINIPPRYGKTELMIHFMAWAIARYPDSNFLYISYSYTVAVKQTQTIKEIIELPQYYELFGVRLKEGAGAKGNFELEQGGSVYAAGSSGSITSRGAGIKGLDRFGGIIAMDDIHKPDEVTSDVMRENVKEWYYNTLQSRINTPKTPIIGIGQRLHEDDLLANLLQQDDYDSIILPALDVAGNALDPSMHSAQKIREMLELSPYETSAQYQQDPQPAGGGIYSVEDFPILEFEPEILTTFITCDTAETDKDWNDKTVFSFWGLYQIEEFGEKLDLYGLHWLDCLELSIEPKDLEPNFKQFCATCMRHKVKPQLAAIEKKSTGTTLLSMLKDTRGLQIIDIERTRASGNKTQRFLEIQPYVKKKLISFNYGDKHVKNCLNHLRKITANNTHRFDDICDTLYDAVKIALIDKTITFASKTGINREKEVVDALISRQNYTTQLRRNAYNGSKQRR